MHILKQVFTTKNHLFLGIIAKEFEKLDQIPTNDSLQHILGRAYLEASQNAKMTEALENNNQQAVVKIAVGIVKQLAHSYVVDGWDYDFREVSKSSISSSVNKAFEELPQNADNYFESIEADTQQVVTDGSSEARSLDEMVLLFQKVGLTDEEIDIVLRTVAYGEKSKDIYKEYGFNSPNTLSQHKRRILKKLVKALKIKGTEK